MHPYIRSVKHFIFIYLIWLPICSYFVLFSAEMAIINLIDAIIISGPPLIILPIIILSNWHLCKNTPYNKNKIINFIFAHTLGVIISIGIWIILSMLYAYSLDYAMNLSLWQERLIRIIPFLIVLGGGVYFLTILINYLLIAIEKNKQLEQNVLENNLAQSQTAYKALRATIHPHFLFNSLNALAGLTKTDSNLAHQLSLQLSDFMRYSLKYEKREIVKVVDEIQHIKNYLGIEKIRLGDRLKINFEIDDNVGEEKIISLVLLPLVENSIKHGIQELINGGTIKIKINKTKNYFHINIENPFEENYKPKKGEGSGLSTLKNRLNLNYGNKATLSVNKNNTIYSVILKIPI